MSEERHIVVPWFSRCEWKSVHQLLFSDNLEDQKKGLEHLIGWKARCPDLPRPIECTLVIFQVLHDDPEHCSDKCVSFAREQQLRLMYSTAVMRFLNLMLDKSAYDREEDEAYVTMYNKAERLNIPQWIVSLRHDAAHGTSLPDLSLLRAATLQALKWLEENYWEKDGKLYKNWHVSKADVMAICADESELNSIVEAWEALTLYKFAGFKSMHHVPDHKLRKTIESMHEIIQYDLEEVSWARELNLSKVPAALSLVVRKLVLCLSTKSGAVDKHALLADLLVAGDVLLPSESILKIVFPDDVEMQSVLQQLPDKLVDSCEDLMYAMWNIGAIPALTAKLLIVQGNPMESDLRKNIAALWLQKILLSCLKVREARKIQKAISEDNDAKAVVEHYRAKISRLIKFKKIISSSLVSTLVDNQRSDLSMGYTWQLQPIPRNLTSVDLVKKAIVPPSKFTNTFLPCLMELVTPPIPTKNRELLLNLINIYCNSESEAGEMAESKIFSLSDVSNTSHTWTRADGQLRNIAMPNPKVTSVASSEFQSPWTLSQEHLEWDKCPLGLLPWQQDKNKLNQEENEMRKLRLLWPKLVLPTGWVEETETISEQSESNLSFGEGGHLRGVRKGRVAKLYTKEKTPKKVLQILNQGTRQKAIQFLVGL